MILIIIYTVLSFILDGILSNYIGSNSYFLTIYTVISLVVIYKYFSNYKKYMIILLILGILFDIVYTNTLLLNVFLFFLIAIFLDSINYNIPNNLLTVNIKSIIAVFIYHISTYIILLMVHYSMYPFKYLLMILLKSIIMTIIYTSISYHIFNKLFYKIYDKKIK